MKCLNCGEDIEQAKMGRKRKYCNETCRQQAFRDNHNVTKRNETQSVTEQTNTFVTAGLW